MEEQTPFEQQPVAEHDTTPPKVVWWKKRNLQLIVGFSLLIAIGLGAFALEGRDTEIPVDDTNQPQITDQVQVIEDEEHPTELVYAYWEDNNVVARSLDWQDKEKTDLLRYSEVNPYPVGATHDVRPAIDYNPTTMQFVYSDATGLQLFDRKTDESQVVAIREASATPGEGPGGGFEWSLGFDGFALIDPTFSRQGNFVAATVGQYEGSRQVVINLEDESLVETGDTFRYVNDGQPQDINVAPAEGNNIFKAMGILPGYYFDIAGAGHAEAGVFSSDASKAGMILPPLLSQPQDTPSSLVLVEGDVDETVLSRGSYLPEIVFSPDDSRLFALRLSDTGDYVIEEWSTSGKNLITSYNVETSFVIPGQLQDVDLYSFDDVYATVKSRKSGQDYAQYVVDVTAQDQLVEFAVDDASAFSLLYAKR